MANMTFKANLLPNTNLGYSLGSSDLKWKINGDQYQEFDYISTSQNNEYNVTTYIIKLINDGYNGGWFWCSADEGRGCPTVDSTKGYQIIWQANKPGNGVNLIASLYGSDHFYKGVLWKNSTNLPSWDRILTPVAADDRYVTLSTAQTITGAKTFTQPIYFSTGSGTTRAILAYDSTYTGHGITYKEGNPDVMTLSASGNANNLTNADLSINGLGDGKVSIRGNEIIHAGNYTSFLDGRYVNVTGDTMTGPLYINNTTDVGLNQNGALVIGNKTGYNIGIDNDEIMARNNSAASTLYLNNEGGAVRTGWLQVINNSSNNTNDAMVYLENQSNSDWAQKILLSTYNYGLFISGTGTNLLKVGDNSTLYIGNADAQVNGTVLKITNNSNTLSIGSQNATFTHIYNSANIPFIFNKDVDVTDKHWLGSTSYPWGGLRLGGTSPSIQYQGTKANKDMIVMIDNTTDANGNGIRIGGGGLTIIGGGESASTLQSNLGYTGGSEVMVVGSDGSILFYPGQDSYDASAQLSMTASRFWAGVNGNTTREAQVGVQSGAGQLYLWSHAATTGNRGLYSPAHGSRAARALVTIDTNNRVYFADSYSGASTALAFSQTGLAGSAISWMACWNGYELRAISKAETFNVVRDNGGDSRWVKKAGDMMTGQLGWNASGSSTARHYTNVAFYENNASSYTGTIKIKLPNTISNMVMMICRILIFDYNSNSGCELLVSGYTYNDKKWYNAAASPLGTFTKGVRLAHDGTNYCILLGATNSTWNYSKIILADVYSGYNAQPESGYAISLITSESGYTISQTLTTLLRADKVYGAVWNDYAEYRKNNPIEKNKQKPGRCVRELGDGLLALTTERLMRGCEIISDTFGFAIGQDKENGYDTPIASSGRVLAYPYESIEEFKTHIGYCVCSGPNGTVSIMTDEEEEKYPGRIIGTISEIPDYEEWGTGKIKVDGRVWIRIK